VLTKQKLATLMTNKKKTLSLHSFGPPAGAKDLVMTKSLPKIDLPGNRQYAVWISYLQLYNDNVYDLLTAKSSTSTARPQLKVIEDVNKVN